MSGDLFSRLGKDSQHLKDGCSGRQKTGSRSDSRLGVVSHPSSDQGFRNKRLFPSVPEGAAGITPQWEQPRRQQVQPTQVRKELIGPSPPAPYIHVTHSTLHHPVGCPPWRQHDRLVSSSKGSRKEVYYLERINNEKDSVLQPLDRHLMFHPTSAPSSKTNQTLVATMGHGHIRDPHDASPLESQQLSEQLRPGNKAELSDLIVRCGWTAWCIVLVAHPPLPGLVGDDRRRCDMTNRHPKQPCTQLLPFLFFFSDRDLSQTRHHVVAPKGHHPSGT